MLTIVHQFQSCGIISYFGISTLVLQGPHDMHITISKSRPFIKVTCLINVVNENYGIPLYVNIEKLRQHHIYRDTKEYQRVVRAYKGYVFRILCAVCTF